MAAVVSGSYSTLLVTESDDRVIVELHRPAVHNAIDEAMVRDLHAVAAILEARPRFAIFTGGAGVFAAGADVADLARRGRAEALAGVNLNLFHRIARLPMPTLAAIDGPAIGGGAELAYACDLRVVTPKARFAQPEPRLGILAGAGATFRLMSLVGESRAKQVLLAGRTLDADDAVAIGLALEVVESDALMDRCGALVDAMVTSSAFAMRLTKLVSSPHGTDGSAAPLLAQALLFEDDQKAERMAAFLARSAGDTGAGRDRPPGSSR